MPEDKLSPNPQFTGLLPILWNGHILWNRHPILWNGHPILWNGHPCPFHSVFYYLELQALLIPFPHLDAAFFWIQDNVGQLIKIGADKQIFNFPQHSLTAAYVTDARE